MLYRTESHELPYTLQARQWEHMMLQVVDYKAERRATGPFTSTQWPTSPGVCKRLFRSCLLALPLDLLVTCGVQYNYSKPFISAELLSFAATEYLHKTSTIATDKISEDDVLAVIGRSAVVLKTVPLEHFAYVVHPKNTPGRLKTCHVAVLRENVDS